MPKKNPITIYDLARELGISPSTVSRALHDNPVISAEVRKKVQALAKKLKYRQNTLAASLRMNRTHCIGIIVPRINRHFFATVISGMQDEAQEHGYTILIGQTNERIEREHMQLNAMISSRVDGIMVSPTMYTTNFSTFAQCKAHHIPLLFFDRTPQHGQHHRVVGDDFHGGWLATEHLIQQGYRRIAHFCGKLSASIYQQRLAGYRAALQHYGLSFHKRWVIEHELTAESTPGAIEKLLRLEPLPDAIFIANDTSALHSIKLLQTHGIRIPEDMGIVGYSNDPAGELISPPLSTIDQKGYLLGRTALQTMLDLIKYRDRKRTPSPITITIPVELIVRASSVKQPASSMQSLVS
ncbi:MAG: LacI family DNA-binding transcriptional regulator [Thermoflavifilum sp.]|uniref:LacI family DNA-binding transcriptional regulator n=1 Tax=Thermoflavifilum sp. TaxID=1968839 RepID=UPI0018A63B92|nr:LacI family DNA-binding transcriptional regulator [Thermoflavifilum sp.]QOR75392.1 MAG: LacI family DNA-binding transcriptional regulator [Thermoflavifilum sp.]